MAARARPILGNVRVEVNGGGVLEGLALVAHRFQDMRVAVADGDGGDAGKGVEVTPALLVPDVLAFAFHDHQRLLVEVEERRVQELLAQAIDFVGGRAGVRFGLVWRRR